MKKLINSLPCLLQTNASILMLMIDYSWSFWSCIKALNMKLLSFKYFCSKFLFTSPLYQPLLLLMKSVVLWSTNNKLYLQKTYFLVVLFRAGTSWYFTTSLVKILRLSQWWLVRGDIFIDILTLPSQTPGHRGRLP